jgi:hypothetical protein
VTEREWLAEAEPWWMLEWLRVNDRLVEDKRKLWLFACACCRGAWDRLGDERLQAHVCVAEQFADSQATEAELLGVERGAEPVWGSLLALLLRQPSYAERGWDPPLPATGAAAMMRFFNRSLAVAGVAPVVGADFITDAERNTVADLVRDTFGNPFRLEAFDPIWRTPATEAIAAGAYESRDFSALPILADALEEAGCREALVLDHCRSGGPHVRGCWVVDAVLGRS